LAWPGGAPPWLGHGGCGFDWLVDAGVGFGVGSFVAFGVGLAVGAGVGFGVTFAVGAGVGFGVTFAVGAGVGLGVGFAVGAEVGLGVGLPVDVGWLARGDDVVPGALVGLPGTAGEAVATAMVGVGLTVTPVTVGDEEGDGIGPPGDAVGPGDGSELPGDAIEPPVGAAVRVGVGTTAIAFGPALALARCCNSTPPTPSTIVARTRFRAPRLRMSRVR
jgi:hypothetical protein